MTLRVTELSAGYGEKTVIEDISLEIASSSFYGVIGPNGAGKSTLFKTASGVLKPFRGCVGFKDRDIFRMHRRELARHMAAVPQFQSTGFPYRVREFVQMGRYPHMGRFGLSSPKDAAIVEEAMASMEVEFLAGKRTDALSGGEFQRVCIAQAIAQEPELMMLDEPTSHLDIGHQSRLLSLLKGWCATKGITVVLILHDLNLASAYCDRLALLHQGRIFSEGVPSNVLTKFNIEAVYGTKVDVVFREGFGYPNVFIK